jgi:hypothetical protein
MVRLFIIVFVAYLFSGCAINRVKIEPIQKLPHYTKDKANVYFTNGQDERNLIKKIRLRTQNHINFSYKIIGKNNTIEGTNCYSQYSYNALEEGEYEIKLLAPSFQLYGKREDHGSYKNYFKKGEIYILKIQGEYDNKATWKQAFSFGGVFSPSDLKLKLIEISENEGIKQINQGMSIIHPIKRSRDYPIRAEDNPKDERCRRSF